MSVKDKLKSRLKRWHGKAELLSTGSRGKEVDFTFWGGYSLGFIEGKIAEIEDMLDILEEDWDEEEHY